MYYNSLALDSSLLLKCMKKSFHVLELIALVFQKGSCYGAERQTWLICPCYNPIQV